MTLGSRGALAMNDGFGVQPFHADRRERGMRRNLTVHAPAVARRLQARTKLRDGEELRVQFQNDVVDAILPLPKMPEQVKLRALDIAFQD